VKEIDRKRLVCVPHIGVVDGLSSLGIAYTPKDVECFSPLRSRFKIRRARQSEKKWLKRYWVTFEKDCGVAIEVFTKRPTQLPKGLTVRTFVAC